MDELIARLDECGAMPFGSGPICREAAAALRSAQERERELLKVANLLCDTLASTVEHFETTEDKHLGVLLADVLFEARFVLEKYKEK